jgi:glycogen debranching enzyme
MNEPFTERSDLAGPKETVTVKAQTLATRYRERASQLARNFRQFFWRGDRLIDHLKPDGSADTQVRPNGLLAVLASPDLFDPQQRQWITTEAARHLVMPWGIRSLSADDPAYHRKHLDLARYYYDEAYHNGDIWLWLSGAYITALNDPREGFGQTRMLLTEVMQEGAVGTLQEIRDGDLAETNDEFGGATSQAWSLAELLRTVVGDYLGLQVDLTAVPPRVQVTPFLPTAWPSLTVRTRLGDFPCLIECRPGPLVTLHFERPVPEDWVVSLGWAGEILVDNANTRAGRQHTPSDLWSFKLSLAGGRDVH